MKFLDVTGRATIDTRKRDIATARGRGVGKALLNNQFNVAARWGISQFNFKAGKEDGPFFWSRRGAAMSEAEWCRAKVADLESAILELGDLSNEQDAKFISQTMNQRKIAEKIVSALITY